MTHLTLIKRHIPVMVLLMVLLSSCEKKSSSTRLLREAQNVVMEDPSKALVLLDSIAHPDQMNKNKYMQYIVARVQAKYKCFEDIAQDTLIFEAEKYLRYNNNLYQTALANFYAASVCRENKWLEREMEYLLQAEKYALRAKDNTLSAWSIHWIGNIYYDQNMIDSAIVNYRRTLPFYNKDKSLYMNELQAIVGLGQAYEIVNEFDSTFLYFYKGLNMAQEFKNKDSEITFTRLLAMRYRKNGEYDKTKSLFKDALIKTTKTEDSLWIHNGLAKLYNKTTQLDSAKYYIEKIKEKLPIIRHNKSLEDIYETISDYNEKSGNYKEALYYSRLKDQIDQKIMENNNSLKLLNISRKEMLSIQKERERSYLYAACAIFVILFIILIGYFKIKSIHQKERQKNELLKIQMKSQKELLETQTKLLERKSEDMEYMESIYQNIVTDWVAIDKKVQALRREYDVEVEPEIFQQIRRLIEAFKQKTNNRFIQQAIEYFKEQPYGEEVLEVTSRKELLLFMLCLCNYKKPHISTLLGVQVHNPNMQLRLLGLRNKLKKAGMPDDEIEEILFKE